MGRDAELTAEQQMAGILNDLRYYGVPPYVCQFNYTSGQTKHAADFAWPLEKILLEVQGGVWSAKSGHSGGTGITNDCIRGNLAAVHGYRVIRVTTAQIKDEVSGKSCYISDTLCQLFGIERKETEAARRIREVAAEVAKDKRKRRSVNNG
jgi:hypothetical protein